MGDFINVAVQGCCHGELDTIYATIASTEQRTGRKVDLLIVCGDFECVRDIVDLNSMAVPQKFRHLKTFHKYFNGEVHAPVKTVFIGGNHEASNVLQSLYYGGYVAPNIYFLGFGGVINFRGLRIGGLSGIYNDKHYTHGHFERPPFSDNTMRSIYHVRALEVQRMLSFPKPVNSVPSLDIFLTHDWPTGIWNYGNCQALLQKKPFFRDEINNNTLGSPPSQRLLHHLQPSFWFAGHMHVKFTAVVPQGQSDSTPGSSSVESAESASPAHSTRFLALDKVVPGRDFIQFLSIPVLHSASRTVYDDDELHFDAEWCSILAHTHNELRKTRFLYSTSLPMPIPREVVENVEQQLIAEYGPSLVIPNFSAEHQSCGACGSGSGGGRHAGERQRLQEGNAQTDRFLQSLDLPHIWTVPFYLPATPAPPTSALPAPAPVPAPAPQVVPAPVSSASASSLQLVPSRVAWSRPPPPPAPPAATVTSPTHSITQQDPNELDI